MSVDEPDVIPSAVDPDCECVKVTPDMRPSMPPPGAAKTGRALCPEGYLPRRRRRAPYQLRGKEVVTGRPAEPNPEPPPGLLGDRARVDQGTQRLQESEGEESRDDLIASTLNELEEEDRRSGENG